MKARVDYKAAAPEAFAAMHGLERYVRECGLEHSLLELLKLRALQMNGFGYRIDMLTKGARAIPALVQNRDVGHQ
jgi:hypothetical protein